MEQYKYLEFVSDVTYLKTLLDEFNYNLQIKIKISPYQGSVSPEARGGRFWSGVGMSYERQPAEHSLAAYRQTAWFTC